MSTERIKLLDGEATLLRNTLSSVAFDPEYGPYYRRHMSVLNAAIADDEISLPYAVAGTDVFTLLNLLEDSDLNIPVGLAPLTERINRQVYSDDYAEVK